MYVIDADFSGCGIIKKGSQQTIDITGIDLNWQNLCKYRNYWLNLISIEEFFNKT
jgi:hypothetical protein